MKAKEEGKGAKVLIAAAAFIVVAAFCGIAAADPYTGGLPLTTVKEGEVSGGLWFDHYCPMANWTEDFTLPSYTDVEWAHLYVAVYCGCMQSNYAGRANITFNGVPLGGTPDGLSSEEFDVCYTFPGETYSTQCARGASGYNVAPGPGTGPEWVNDHCVRVTSDYLMWYNVTDLVQPNSNVSVKTWKREGYTGTFDGRVTVGTLVVAYNDGDSDTVHYWVNRGHDVDNSEDYYIGKTNFTADLPSGTITQNANLSVVHKASTNGAYTFNSISIPTYPDSTTTPPGEWWQGAYSGYNTWYASSLFNSNSNNTLTYDRVAPYYKIMLAFLTADYVEGGWYWIEVNKTVWDLVNETWVQEVTASVDDIVRFRLWVHNNGSCCNLTNITVIDTLSDSLNYSDNATVNGIPQEPVKTGPSEYVWNFTGPLAPCQNITIEFDARVVECGTDTNVVNVTGWCNETMVSDEDSANVTAPCAGICGDVDGLPGVTTNDGRQIFMYLLYGPGQYPLADLWAADCDGLCDGITTNDGRQIFMNLLYGSGQYPLVCC